MTSSLDELLDAIVVAAGRRRLEVAQAKQLIGELVLDAAGVILDAEGDWHEQLVAAGLDPAVVDRAHTELSDLGAVADVAGEPVTETTGEPIEMLLEHIKVLGGDGLLPRRSLPPASHRRWASAQRRSSLLA